MKRNSPCLSSPSIFLRCLFSKEMRGRKKNIEHFEMFRRRWGRSTCTCLLLVFLQSKLYGIGVATLRIQSSKNCCVVQLDGRQLLKESLHCFMKLLFRVTRKVTLCTTIDWYVCVIATRRLKTSQAIYEMFFWECVAEKVSFLTL